MFNKLITKLYFFIVRTTCALYGHTWETMGIPSSKERYRECLWCGTTQQLEED